MELREDVLERHKQEWEELASVDPLWAISTDAEHRGGRWELGEFFDTGEAEISEVLKAADDLGEPVRRGRALDFGCGVGRLSRPLAKRFRECVGLDISEGMVKLARELNEDRPNCRFVVNDAPDLAAARIRIVRLRLLVARPSAHAVGGDHGEVRRRVPAGSAAGGARGLPGPVAHPAVAPPAAPAARLCVSAHLRSAGGVPADADEARAGSGGSLFPRPGCGNSSSGMEAQPSSSSPGVLAPRSNTSRSMRYFVRAGYASKRRVSTSRRDRDVPCRSGSSPPTRLALKAGRSLRRRSLRTTAAGERNRGRHGPDRGVR